MKKEVKYKALGTDLLYPGKSLLNKVSFSLWLLIVFVLLAMFFIFLQSHDYKQSASDAVSLTTQIWVPASPFSSILFLIALAGKITVIYVIVVMIEAAREGSFRSLFKRK